MPAAVQRHLGQPLQCNWHCPSCCHLRSTCQLRLSWQPRRPLLQQRQQAQCTLPLPFGLSVARPSSPIPRHKRAASGRILRPSAASRRRRAGPDNLACSETAAMVIRRRGMSTLAVGTQSQSQSPPPLAVAPGFQPVHAPFRLCRRQRPSQAQACQLARSRCAGVAATAGQATLPTALVMPPVQTVDLVLLAVVTRVCIRQHVGRHRRVAPLHARWRQRPAAQPVVSSE